MLFSRANLENSILENLNLFIFGVFLMLKKIFFAIMMIAITATTYSQNCDILEQVVKASGGREKLNSVKSTYAEIKTKVVQGQEMEMMMKMWTKGDNKFYMEQDIMGMTMKIGIDGNKGWMVNPMAGGTQDLPADQLGAIKNQNKRSAGFGLFSDWKEQGYKCEDLGVVDIDEKKCTKVKVTEKDNSVVTYYIDVITNLIHKFESSEQGMNIAVYFKQYQKKDGMFYPKKMETHVNGSLAATMDFIKFETNIDIDDAKFKKP